MDLGQAAIAPGYDVQGNLTTALFDRYTHDAQNRLVEFTRSGSSPSSARYSYDDAGQRLSKTVDGVTTQFVLDGNQLLEEYDGNGGLLRRYVYAGLDEPVRMNTVAGAEFYYHQDGLGSVVALTNASGFLVETYAYGPYGETEGPSSVSNPFRYTGREYDAETALYYYRARYYSPGLGRFLEPDPIGFGDGLNVYAYVGNNPINFVDPLGLFQTGQSGFSPAGFRASQADLDFLNAIDRPIQPAIGPVELLGGVASLARLGVAGIGSALARQVTRGVANPIPSRLARVIPGNVKPTTLGRPGADDVFVTAADDIAGLNPTQLANRLTIPQSRTFTVLEFDTPASGLASPVFRNIPGFVGGGRTAGGAREFVLPNGPIPQDAVRRLVGP